MIFFSTEDFVALKKDAARNLNRIQNYGEALAGLAKASIMPIIQNISGQYQSAHRSFVTQKLRLQSIRHQVSAKIMPVLVLNDEHVRYVSATCGLILFMLFVSLTPAEGKTLILDGVADTGSPLLLATGYNAGNSAEERVVEEKFTFEESYSLADAVNAEEVARLSSVADISNTANLAARDAGMSVDISQTTSITRNADGLTLGEMLNVPAQGAANTGKKTYMDYRTITAKNSTQYKMQQSATTDEQGFRRYEGYYMIALGKYYSEHCGDKFLITLSSGVSFAAITGDIKSNLDTDVLHQHKDGNIVEFIVDRHKISKTCRSSGDMSNAGFEGHIVSIQRIV